MNFIYAKTFWHVLKLFTAQTWETRQTWKLANSTRFPLLTPFFFSWWDHLHKGRCKAEWLDRLAKIKLLKLAPATFLLLVLRKIKWKQVYDLAYPTQILKIRISQNRVAKPLLLHIRNPIWRPISGLLVAQLRYSVLFRKKNCHYILYGKLCEKRNIYLTSR